MGKTALLLVLLRQSYFGLDAAGGYHRKVGPDEVHEVLARELTPDAGFEVGRGGRVGRVLSSRQRENRLGLRREKLSQ